MFFLDVFFVVVFVLAVVANVAVGQVALFAVAMGVVSCCYLLWTSVSPLFLHVLYLELSWLLACGDRCLFLIVSCVPLNLSCVVRCLLCIVYCLLFVVWCGVSRCLFFVAVVAVIGLLLLLQ